MSRRRELIEPHPGDKRYIRRAPDGTFTTDQVDVNRSLSADNNQRARRDNTGGQGDRGDRRAVK